MTVMPGAEPFHADGGPHGVLMCHGFTGTPQSLRPWAEHFAAAGYAVSLPRLPGHGTRWQDMQATAWTDWYDAVEHAFTDLRTRCDTVYACGLSMGGALALRLAETHPDGVTALVLVNPAIGSYRRDLALLPVLSKLVASRPGIGSDIKKPGTVELAYGRTPLRAAYQMTRLWKAVCADLGRVRAPTLVYRSRADHVVDGRSSSLIRLGVRNAPVDERMLENSFHVATLDHDAPTIFDGSLRWMREHRHSRQDLPPALLPDGDGQLPSSPGESVQSAEPAG